MTMLSQLIASGFGMARLPRANTRYRHRVRRALACLAGLPLAVLAVGLATHATALAATGATATAGTSGAGAERVALRAGTAVSAPINPAEAVAAEPPRSSTRMGSRC
jgi:uncharacterized membrane protein YccC